MDSHTRMGVVEGDWAALDETELKPYRIVLERGTSPAAVMTAHLWIEALDADRAARDVQPQRPPPPVAGLAGLRRPRHYRMT